MNMKHLNNKKFYFVIFLPFILNLLIFIFSLVGIYMCDNINFIIPVMIFVGPISFLYTGVAIFRIYKELVGLMTRVEKNQ